MAYELTRLDMQIIAELQKDGRTSLSEVARAVGVTHTTVRNRLERLLQEDFIAIKPWLNALRLNLSTACLIAIRTPPDKVEEVAQKLAEYSEVRYVGITMADLPINIEVVVSSNSQLYDFIQNHITSRPEVTEIRTQVVLRVLKTGYQWRPTKEYLSSSPLVEPGAFNNDGTSQDVGAYSSDAEDDR